jgi:uncharacterized membrane protein
METRRWAAVGGLVTVAGGYAAYRRRRPGAASGQVEIQRSLTIQRSRAEVYRSWRDPGTQPLVWGHFAELTDVSSDGARWRVEAPLRRSLEWETRIVEDAEAERVRWESVDGDLPNEGTVEFRDAPGDLGTEITLRVRFDPPAGALGDVAVRLLDDPPKLVLAKTLRRFKSLVESGEIPSTERNPSARSD